MQDHRNIVVVLVVALVAAAIAIVTLLSLRDNIDEARGTRDIGRQGVDTGAPEEAATARAAGFALDEPPEPTATAEPAPTPTPAFPATVLDVLVANVRWAESSELVDETSLGQVLAGDGPFTLFAPRNGAFAEIGTALDDGILGNDYAEEILSYHIVLGSLSLADLGEAVRRQETSELVTLQGESLRLALTNEGLLVNGSALVTSGDERAVNGVVHSVDNALVPTEAALNLIVTDEPITFEAANSNLTPESMITLDGIAEILAKNDVSVTVQGHSDDSGDPITNQNLSQSRARAVVNYLVTEGIDNARLSARGLGPSRPIADNSTDEGRALNRRIDFRVG